METPGGLIYGLRSRAGLSQRALALRAGTSQPAIARYERGTTTPSLETLQRLAAACGRQLQLSAVPTPDPHDVELAEELSRLAPEQRLRALTRFARLRRLAANKEEAGK